MASAKERIKEKVEDKHFIDFQRNAELCFLTCYENLYFVGDENIRRIRALVFNYAKDFGEERYFKHFITKMTELLREVERIMQNSSSLAWYIYWQQQRYTLNNLLQEQIRDSRYKNEAEIARILIVALEDAADSGFALGQHYLQLYQHEYQQGRNYHDLWLNAITNFQAAVMDIEYMQAISQPAANKNLFKILWTKQFLLTLFTHYDNPRNPQYPSILSSLQANVGNIVVDEYVTAERLEMLRAFIAQQPAQPKDQLPRHEQHSQYVSDPNPVSLFVEDENSYEEFLKQYQLLLADLKAALGLEYKSPATREVTKNKLTLKKAAAESYLKEIKEKCPVLQPCLELIEINLDAINDRLIAIGLLEQNDTRIQSNYQAFLAELELEESQKSPAAKTKTEEKMERRQDSPTSLLSPSPSKATTTADDGQDSSESAASKATSPVASSIASAAAGPLPSFALSRNTQTKKLFAQATTSLQNNNPALAIAFMQKAIPLLVAEPPAVNAFAHAFFADCLMLKIANAGKYHGKKLRAGVLAETTIRDGKQCFLILDTLEDMQTAIVHIEQALTSIAKLTKPYPATIDEVLLGLNMLKDNLLEKTIKIQDHFQAKAKEREEIMQQKKADGSWFSGKPHDTISIQAQFYQQAIKPNLEPIARMKIQLTAHAEQITIYRQRRAAAAAGPSAAAQTKVLMPRLNI